MTDVQRSSKSHRRRSGMGQGAVSNWWEAGGATGCLIAYQPVGAASYADSLVNLANPGTYDAYAGVAPTWDAVNGWSFDGINDYLRTGYNPNFTGYTYAIQFTNCADQSARNYLYGAYESGVGYMCFYPSAWNQKNWNTNAGGTSPGVAAGNALIAGGESYIDGVWDSTSGDAAKNRELYIGCLNNNGTVVPTPTNYRAGSVQAFGVWANVIPAVAAMVAAMAAL